MYLARRKPETKTIELPCKFRRDTRQVHVKYERGHFITVCPPEVPRLRNGVWWHKKYNSHKQGYHGGVMRHGNSNENQIVEYLDRESDLQYDIEHA